MPKPKDIEEIIGEKNVISVFDPRNPDVRVGDVYVVAHVGAGSPAFVVPTVVTAVAERGFEYVGLINGSQQFSESLKGILFREYGKGKAIYVQASEENVEFWRNAAKTMPKRPSMRITR